MTKITKITNLLRDVVFAAQFIKIENFKLVLSCQGLHSKLQFSIPDDKTSHYNSAHQANFRPTCKFCNTVIVVLVFFKIAVCPHPFTKK